MFLCNDSSEVKDKSAAYFFVIEATEFYFILVVAGNAHWISYTDLECTSQSLTSSNVIGSSHLCASCMVVLSCWRHMKLENCCFRLSHPSNFVNVSMMSAIATCYWSRCLLSVFQCFVRIIYRVWTCRNFSTGDQFKSQ